MTLTEPTGSTLPRFSIMLISLICLICADVNSVINNFYSVNFYAFNRIVPLRTCYKSNCQAHYPHKIRRIFSKKCTAWKQYRTFRTQELLAKYYHPYPIASKCRSAIYSHHADVEKVINSENTNKFYRYANHKFTNKSLIGPLKSDDGSLLIDPIRKAQVIANYLCIYVYFRQWASETCGFYSTYY